MTWLNKKTFFIILAASLSFWLLDAAIDYYFFIRRPLLYMLINWDAYAHEIFMRLTTIFVIIVFGLFLSKYIYQLNESEGRYRQLFDNIDSAVFVQTAATQESPARFVEVNQAGCRYLGYGKEDLLQHSPLEIFPPEVHHDLAARMQELMAHQPVLFETSLAAKDGRQLPVEISALLFDLHGKTRILSIARDISERQRAEAALREAYEELERRVAERTAELAQANLELKREVAERQRNEFALRQSEGQLRLLTAQLLTAEEQERRRISMELHDELGQALMYLKFQMGLLCKRLEQQGKSVDIDFQPILNYIDGIVQSVRRLSQDLNPGVLEELGITSAIRYLLEKFSEHHPLQQSSVEIDEIDDLFPQSSQIHIFRILQECLTNVFRHAQASRVSVTVKRQGDRLLLVVEDNGQGFDPQQVLSTAEMRKGVGLAALQERARILGGSMDIRSQKDSGTRITCTIPIMGKGLEHETI